MSADTFEFSGTGSTILFESGANAGLLADVSGYAVGDDFVFFGDGTAGSVAIVQNPGILGLGASTAIEFVNATGGTFASYTLAAVNCSLTAADFSVTRDPTGTGMEVAYIACYCRGTRIATDGGERPVEDLAIGDRVVTSGGGLRPIRWIGYRAYAAPFIAGQAHLLPIRIAAGALDDNVPARDLMVSPEHGIYLDGVLIPARHLINGESVRQEDARDLIEYYHVELDSHGVLLAEGASAESYVDDGNRAMFQNAASYRAARGDDAAIPAAYCAERLTRGDRFEAIRERIDRRAGLRGRFSDDPDLHLLADGVVVRPSEADGERYRFDLDKPARTLIVKSRIGVTEGDDARILGVAISAMQCDGAAVDLAQLAAPGWHGAGGDSARRWRWTDGAAHLPPGEVAKSSCNLRNCRNGYEGGARRIDITVCGRLRYREIIAEAPPGRVATSWRQPMPTAR
ncbi:Hint domain-containing protein [Acidiphilium sp. AL]|uniref:Hint domain-containing protein n=1 Tax=Acidiphilium iwatense TaxID=768198 RepID=A0ABS9DSQ8_9PROT|nr:MULTISPECIES: Hint domain-containing protein [Acidiphilium]MCF3945699.1 Hint domain-containing protein [Acidiphilium iwatense]MCU4159279.1 Hint domain-containing protein [Acidiphilium sp. AL]